MPHPTPPHPARAHRPKPSEAPPWLTALNPFSAASRAFRNFHPRRAPALSRANYAREMFASVFLPFSLAVVEGGVLGVIVRKYFNDLIPNGDITQAQLNLAVAAVQAAPAFANIVSFAFVRLAHGRHKVRAVNALQVTIAALVAAMALAPRSPAGLALLLACGLLARVAYAGIVTLRSSVWRANYPRAARARLTGRIAALQTLVSTAVALLLGAALQADERTFRLFLPAAALLSLVGVRWWGRVRMRGHASLLRLELAALGRDRPSFNPARLWALLAADPPYAEYMAAQMVLGMGNMMTFAVITILTQERFAMGYFSAIAITHVFPAFLTALFVGPWSRLLDRWHIARYRALHSWVFVAMSAAFALAAALGSLPFLYLASVLRGIGFAGAAIAWNLGHDDYATDANAAQYMAVHSTLTGLRGLIAPFAGVALYEWLGTSTPLAGGVVFALSALITAAAALWFALMTLRPNRPHTRPHTHSHSRPHADPHPQPLIRIPADPPA